jgi:NAD(P)-dependent dehydrogenase (short-subunit alcohol dehydrogenase family)
MLVNNAGVSGETGPLETQEKAGWQWTIDVNLMAIFIGSKVVVPRIKSHGEGGWLINVASMAGMAGLPLSGAYGASKFAVVGLSESWALEFKTDNIKVSVLCPAFVKTRIHESERNRSENYPSEKTKTQDPDHTEESKKRLVESGIDAAIVGKRTVEALKSGEFYIFTHPNYRAVLQKRAHKIDAAMERAEQSQLLQDIGK